MKKTLAAVLAAAMALSTASVAFAKDTLNGDTILDGTGDYPEDSSSFSLRFGKTYTYILSADVLEGVDIDPYQLGEWVKEGKATVTATVTEGMSNLSGKPTASLRDVHTSDTIESVYKWKGIAAQADGEVEVKGKVIAKNGEEVKAIPLFDNNGVWDLTLTETDVQKVVHKGDKDWDAAVAILENYPAHFDEVNEGKVSKGVSPVVQVKLGFAHTYGTSDKSAKMKFRITFKKDVDGYDKGDTVMTDEVKFTASYQKMDDKGHDMELTLEECSNDVEEVLMNDGDELYDKIGSDEFTVYFENSASFTGKMAPNQKTLNLLYSVSDISDVVDAYPNIDFEFIEFKGQVANATTFVNTGSMSFNAIGGDETVVYEMDSEGGLTKLDGTYNKIANTIDVKGIKRLTTYVIAETELPEEEEPEEPSEPASSAPAIEDDNNGNPNTGAC